MSYVMQPSTSFSIPASQPVARPAFSGSRFSFQRTSQLHVHSSSGSAGSTERARTANPAPATPHRDVTTRFGMRLKELRVQRNLTQVRMAREFGVDRSYISDVERGRKSVSLPTMEIFALGLKVSLAELLTGI